MNGQHIVNASMKKKGVIIIFGIIVWGVILVWPGGHAGAQTEVGGGNITDQHWTLSGSPYIVISDVTLGAGVTLTIDPGVIVKFKANTGLFPGGGGTLVANGTAAEQIIFTSYNDDSVSAGGDTSPEDSSSPTAAYWSKVHLQNAVDSIKYAKIRYGNSCLSVSSGTPTIENSTISNCSIGVDVNSVSAPGMTFTMQNNTITGNIVGVKTILASGFTLTNNNIYSNTQGAESLTTDILVTANGNWWGHVNGPCLPAEQPACVNRGSKITAGFIVETFLLSLYTEPAITSGGVSSGAPWTPPPPPKISKFGASPEVIKEGEGDGRVTLAWDTEGADRAMLDGEPVSVSGSKTFAQAKQKSYELVAIGPGGETSQTLTVKLEARDPVIIIPGILGSWRNWLDRLTGFDKPHLDPFFHTYDGLWEGLISVGYEPGKTLFAFPYDWRRDNSETAKVLGDRIDEVLRECDCKKVDLVAHSMGGLVARYYIQNIKNDTVDQLIFLGTPHLGAAKAYLAWEAGEFGPGRRESLLKRVFSIEAATKGYSNILKYIHERIVSVRQLLPIFDYLTDIETGEFYDYQSCRKGIFVCNEFLEKLSTVSPNDYINVRVYSIVSDSFSTFESYFIEKMKDYTDWTKWKHGKPLNYPSLDGIVKSDGDQTVTINSSRWGVESYFKITSKHDDLPYNSQAIVSEILTGKPIVKFGKTKLFKNLLFVGVYSPVDIAVTTPSGKIYGAEAGDDGWAFYSGKDDPEFITIPDPTDGEFIITVTGTGQGGKFGLEAALLSDDQEDSISYQGIIAPGQQFRFSLTNIGSAPEGKTLKLKLIDLTPPVTDFALRGDRLAESVFAPGVVASLKADDDTGGQTETFYSLDDGAAWLKYSRELVFEETGDYQMLYKSVDAAGNTEAISLRRFAVREKPRAAIEPELAPIADIDSITDQTTTTPTTTSAVLGALTSFPDPEKSTSLLRSLPVLLFFIAFAVLVKLIKVKRKEKKINEV